MFLDGLALIEKLDWFDNYGYERKFCCFCTSHNAYCELCKKLVLMWWDLSAIYGLLKHPLTDIGLAQFVADFEKINEFRGWEFGVKVLYMAWQQSLVG
jgi:transaldolase